MNAHEEKARNEVEAFLRLVPKAELHIHIEGSLQPELMFELARRNGVRLPYATVDEVRRAYSFTNLQSFLDIYYAGASVLVTSTDFEDMAWDYLSRAAKENVAHAELFFDPQTHTGRGVELHTVLDGLWSAAERARRELGMSVMLIMCFLRHMSEESAFETLEQALPYRHRIDGVGLDSSELGNPPSRFAAVFARCRALGLRAVAHAGEEGPPEYIREALDLLGAERIDHGVRCMEDPELVRRLAAARIPLTVCPLSNVKLRVFDSMAAHNLRGLLDAGLLVTINSDDPAYFGGYITDNYLECFRSLPLDASHAHRLACNSFEASFLPEAEKRGYIAQVNRVFSSFFAAAEPAA